MTQPSLFEAPAPAKRAPLIGYTRQPRMDAQFERVFGVRMDDYYVHYLYGMDVARFDVEVLNSGDISPEEAMLRRIAAACWRDGVPFSVPPSELAHYLRFLCTGTRGVRSHKPGDDEYERKLDAIRREFQ